MGWAEDEIKAMDTMDVETETSQGEMNTYTGVSLNALLDVAEPAADASTLVIIAIDGYLVEVDLAEIRACQDCTLSSPVQGGFRGTFPGFPGSVAVRVATIWPPFAMASYLCSWLSLVSQVCCGEPDRCVLRCTICHADAPVE